MENYGPKMTLVCAEDFWSLYYIRISSS